MRERIRKVSLQAVREPFVDAQLHRVIARETTGLRQRERPEVRIQSRVAYPDAVHHSSEVLQSVRIQLRLRRIEISEREQVHTARADISHSERGIAKDLAL